jgi:hypothetical protein
MRAKLTNSAVEKFKCRDGGSRTLNLQVEALRARLPRMLRVAIAPQAQLATNSRNA